MSTNQTEVCAACGESYPCTDSRRRDISPTLRAQHVAESDLERQLRTPVIRASWFRQGIPALLLSLALSAPACGAEAPEAPAKPRTKPTVAIAVKVYTDGRVPAGQVKISTADADSCVAWIGEDDDALMVKALRECRAEVAKAKQ